MSLTRGRLCFCMMDHFNVHVDFESRLRTYEEWEDEKRKKRLSTPLDCRRRLSTLLVLHRRHLPLQEVPYPPSPLRRVQ